MKLIFDKRLLLLIVLFVLVSFLCVGNSLNEKIIIITIAKYKLNGMYIHNYLGNLKDCLKVKYKNKYGNEVSCRLNKSYGNK